MKHLEFRKIDTGLAQSDFEVSGQMVLQATNLEAIQNSVRQTLDNRKENYIFDWKKIILKSFSDGAYRVKNPLIGDDVVAMRNALKIQGILENGQMEFDAEDVDANMIADAALAYTWAKPTEYLLEFMEYWTAKKNEAGKPLRHGKED